MASLIPGCASFDEDLSALLDGALAQARERELHAHLAQCAVCSARLAALRRVDAALRALPGRPVPAGLEARLRARLGEERGARGVAPTPREGRGAAPRRPRRWLAWSAAGSAAAAAALAVYVTLGRAPAPPPVARSEAAAPAVELEAAAQASERAAAAPASELAAAAPKAAPGASEVGDLSAVPEEELAVALELDTLSDLELIESLELVERLAAAERPGSG